jgi:hypothetical protein
MPEPKPAWYRLHAATIIAGLLAILTVLGSNVIGEGENVPNVPPPTMLIGPEQWYAFGCPLRFMYRDGYISEDFEQMVLGTHCALFPAHVRVFSLRGLLIDAVASIVIVGAIVVWVERICRATGLGKHFSFASMFALVGWFATIFAMKREIYGSLDMRDYLLEVYDLLYAMRLFLIGAFWFAAMNVGFAALTYLLRRQTASNLAAKANSST